MEKIQTGREFLEEFFSGLRSDPEVDPVIAEALSKLYFDGKMTATNAANELARLRGEAPGQNR